MSYRSPGAVCAIVVMLMATVMGAAWSTRTAAQIPGETAGQMASFCGPYRHALRLAPHGSGNPLVEAPGANGKSDFCWGAFATLEALATLQQAGAIQLYLTGHPKQHLCIPVTAERLQLVKTFLQYMDAHQNLGNTDFGVVLLDAMFGAYPCAPSGA